MASLSIISSSIYEKYVFPFEKKVFAGMTPRAHAKNAVTLLHICGDTQKILPLMAQTGVDILEIDSEVDMAEAKKLVDGRVALMGNLDPTSVLYQGNPDLIRKAAEECMRSCAALEGGFILGSGCEVVPKTPVENMKTLIDTARNLPGKDNSAFNALPRQKSGAKAKGMMLVLV